MEVQPHDSQQPQPSDSADQKRALRRSLLQQRRDLPTSRWQSQSQQLCQRLQSHPSFQTARTVLAYFSVRQEPDLRELWQSAPGKVWGVPRCVGSDLSWHRWQLGDPCPPGAYGIPEPLPEAASIDLATVDLILVPAVACDRLGNRLGYGGGFYDRTLAQLRAASSDTASSDAEAIASMPTTIGIVFEFALLNHLPVEAWDHPLQQICTEQQAITCS